jgi:hypothetical protein
LVSIPADRSEDIATIGGKELRAGTRTSSANKPEDRRRTDAEVERDLRERAVALAADRENLAAELARIRRRRADG